MHTVIIEFSLVRVTSIHRPLVSRLFRNCTLAQSPTAAHPRMISQSLHHLGIREQNGAIRRLQSGFIEHRQRAVPFHPIQRHGLPWRRSSHRHFPRRHCLVRGRTACLEKDRVACPGVVHLHQDLVKNAPPIHTPPLQNPMSVFVATRLLRARPFGLKELEDNIDLGPGNIFRILRSAGILGGHHHDRRHVDSHVIRICLHTLDFTHPAGMVTLVIPSPAFSAWLPGMALLRTLDNQDASWV